MATAAPREAAPVSACTERVPRPVPETPPGAGWGRGDRARDGEGRRVRGARTAGPARTFCARALLRAALSRGPWRRTSRRAARRLVLSPPSWLGAVGVSGARRRRGVLLGGVAAAVGPRAAAGQPGRCGSRCGAAGAGGMAPMYGGWSRPRSWREAGVPAAPGAVRRRSRPAGAGGTSRLGAGLRAARGCGGAVGRGGHGSVCRL